jgi:hypothetical protein
MAGIPETIVRHPNFYRLLFGNQPLYFHQVLYLARLFQDVYTPSDQTLIVNRLIMIVKDVFLYVFVSINSFVVHYVNELFIRPIEKRILAVDWLMALSKSSEEKILLGNYRDFYPPVFDPLDLKEAKLYPLNISFCLY